MKVFRSVKFRLTFWYALILSVILFSFSCFMYFKFAQTLYHNTDANLILETESLANSIDDFLEGVFEKSELADLARLSLNSEAYAAAVRQKLIAAFERWERETHRVRRSTFMVRVMGFDGTVLILNFKNWEHDIILPDYRRDSVFMENGEGFQTINFQRKPIRLYYRLFRFKTRPLFVFEVAKSLEELQNSLSQLVLIMWLSIPGAVFAACVAGWFLAKRSFRPVDQMIGKARQITAAYLKGRLPRTQTGDELDRLAMTLNEMMDRIESSTTAIQNFSTDVSHELKTPLAIIRGEIDLALRKTRSTESLVETLRVIEEEVNGLIHLVDDLILLVRSDSKQLRFEKKEVSLSEILEHVYQRFLERARAKKISLRLVLDRDFTVLGDALYLKRLFSNLVDNALKFTNENGHVVIHLEVKNQSSLVKIVDDGMGIEYEMQEKVFSRFYRTDQARSHEGSGLGLNIAKAICDAHQGTIHIQSQPGQGTSVSVELPTN